MSQFDYEEIEIPEALLKVYNADEQITQQCSAQQLFTSDIEDAQTEGKLNSRNIIEFIRNYILTENYELSSEGENEDYNGSNSSEGAWNESNYIPLTGAAPQATTNHHGSIERFEHLNYSHIPHVAVANTYEFLGSTLTLDLIRVRNTYHVNTSIPAINLDSLSSPTNVFLNFDPHAENNDLENALDTFESFRTTIRSFIEDLVVLTTSNMRVRYKDRLIYKLHEA